MSTIPAKPAFDTDADVTRAVKAGARGYLLKDAGMAIASSGRQTAYDQIKDRNTRGRCASSCDGGHLMLIHDGY